MHLRSRERLDTVNKQHCIWVPSASIPTVYKNTNHAYMGTKSLVETILWTTTVTQPPLTWQHPRGSWVRYTGSRVCRPCGSGPRLSAGCHSLQVHLSGNWPQGSAFSPEQNAKDALVSSVLGEIWTWWYELKHYLMGKAALQDAVSSDFTDVTRA